MGCKGSKQIIEESFAETGILLIHCEDLPPITPPESSSSSSSEEDELPQPRTFIGIGGKEIIIPPGFGGDLPIFAGLVPTKKPVQKIEPEPRPMDVTMVYRVPRGKININPYASDDKYYIKESKVTVLENNRAAKKIMETFRRIKR